MIKVPETVDYGTDGDNSTPALRLIALIPLPTLVVLTVIPLVVLIIIALVLFRDFFTRLCYLTSMFV